ncbi:LysM peptidoglycan-binding domain-containing protein [Flectobacillus sp. DC10W]|uniref:LysM peptidoglycan-binding domain-containing protein n=1 Tax=Flectobacillus longus TaxID=2984207 RepID=A0ABT6YIW2_9BACT|nr:LysM peptidoglycan-binding domain-containing protein [Flectobacillus longus]MDI9863537.1 LysM peptidoglycan-binding domain-containing protein [Flectobacillus longus]
MKLYRYLTLLVVFFPSLLMAQDVPSSMLIGSVNVKITDDARTKIQNEISPLTISPSYLNRMVSRMLTYLPAIERILQEERVPDEIKYLCVQESFLSPDARSTSDAIGYWQFKKETARDFNLRVDAVVDERKHLMASTKAACSYFKKHKDLLGNWVASILSYRLGYTSFRKAKEMEWANKSEITVTGETDWYIIRFLAHKLVLDQEYNKAKQNPPTSNPVLFEYSKTKGKSLYEIATYLKVSTQELELSNSWLTSKSIPDDKDYTLYLIVDPMKYQELTTIVDSDNNNSSSSHSNSNTNGPDTTPDVGFPVLKRLSPANTNPNEPIYYEINGKKGILALEGDTPEKIAERGDISLKKFLKYNDLEDNERIIPNQVYYLRKKDRKAQVAFHTVRGNESLWQISQMYGINLDDLKEKNRITTVQRLQKGRLLYLIDTRSERDDIQISTEGEQPQPPKDSNKNTIPTPPKESTKPDNSSNSGVDKMPTPILVNPGNSTKPADVPVTPPNNSKKEQNDPLDPVYPTTNTKPTNPTPPSVPSDVNDSKKNLSISSHRVEAKQTYYSIARLYNMSVADLYQLNDIDASVTLRVGQDLKVYKNGGSDALIGNKENVIPNDNKKPKPSMIDESNSNSPEKVNSQTKTPENSNTSIFSRSTNKPIFKIVHTVQKGETLFRIAQFYNVSAENLRNWNSLPSNNVEVGQELSIPGEFAHLPSEGAGNSTYTSTVTNEPVRYQNDNPQSETKYHTVKAGETAFRISQMYGLSVPQFLKMNGLSSPSISAGQKLKVK